MITINTEQDVVDYCLAGGEDVMIFYHYPISNVRLDLFPSKEAALTNTKTLKRSSEQVVTGVRDPLDPLPSVESFKARGLFPVEPQDLFKIRHLEIIKDGTAFMAELTKVSTSEVFWTWHWIQPHDTFCKLFHIVTGQ